MSWSYIIEFQQRPCELDGALLVTQQPHPTKALWLTIQWGESDVAGFIASIQRPEAVNLFQCLRKPLSRVGDVKSIEEQGLRTHFAIIG